MRKLGLFLLLFSTAVIGSGIAVKHYTDQLQLGVATSGDDKEIIINTGDGATNPKISVDGTSKEFSFNKVINALANVFDLGDGTTADKKLNFDKGAGANNPFIGYDQAQDALVFSNDGTLVKKIGSGSGSGGGGVNIMENSGFEDGIDSNWSYTPGRVIESSVPLIGEKSATFDPVNQFEFIQSDLKTIPSGLHGTGCQAEFAWKGGDENYTIELLNGNGTVLDSKVLSTRTVFSPDSFFFLCPNDTEMAGDSNLGTYQLKVYQHTLVDADPIDLDSFYIGNLKGLSETVLPDGLSGRVTSTGTLLTESVQGTFAASRNSIGNYDIDFNLGLTVKAAVFVTDASGATTTNCSGYSLSFTKVRVICHGTSTTSPSDRDFYFSITKQGADAKQSVQVYKAIPKISENVNDFSAVVDGNASIISQNSDAIQSCATGSTGIFSCIFKVGLFNVAPKVGITHEGNTGRTFGAWVDNVTTTGFSYYNRSESGTYGNNINHISISRQGSDHKTANVQNISLAGIAVNSYAEQSQKQVRVESCEVTNSGTPTSSDVKCGTWVESISDLGTGNAQINYKVGIFSGTPSCTCSVSFGANSQVCGAETTGVSVETIIGDNNGNIQDRNFHIICVGEK